MEKTTEPWDVGIDLDGCVYDFAAAMQIEAAIRYPSLDVSQKVHSWAFYESWGISLEEFQDLYSSGVREGRVLWQGDPYPGTAEAWNFLAEEGHSIHIITDRRPPGAEEAAREATVAWLATHGLTYASLTFSPDKTLIRRIARDPERTIFVDDKHENHTALQMARVRSFLMDRPWNQRSPGPRVRDLAHYAERVTDLTGRWLAQA